MSCLPSSQELFRDRVRKLLIRVDTTVLYKLTYGVYIIGVFKDGLPSGCVVNTCFQITSDKPLLAVSLNKKNYTLEAIRETKRFSLSILAEHTSPELIGKFGFFSSRDTDKYSDAGFEVIGYTPCVNGRFAGRLILEAEKFVEFETHVLVVARLVDTVSGEGVPMTYAYYHDVIKGSAPANAPTFRIAGSEGQKTTAKKRLVCDICGYTAEFDADLPEDYACPICGASISHFRPE